MNGLKITDVSIGITKGNNKKLLAMVDITLNDCFELKRLRIYKGTNGSPFVSYPIDNTSPHDIRQNFYPIEKECREKFEEVILSVYDHHIALNMNAKKDGINV